MKHLEKKPLLKSYFKEKRYKNIAYQLLKKN